MNPCATAEASTSTLSGASVQSANGNNFTNIGGNMVKVEHVEQNVKLTLNRCCTAGDDAPEVREDARSGPIVTTNVFDTLATLLGGIFGLKVSETDLITSGNIPQQSAPDYDARDHSEPRVTITEITDMMAVASLSILDAFNSTISSSTQSSFSERYIRSMLECNEGYPLYEPEPESQYWHEGVRVGDVGLVMEDGGFDFLFNVCPPPDIPTNPAELPDDFEMLRSPDILVKAHFQSETRLFNNRVKRTEEPDGKYTCSGPEGGVLELPSGATRFEAKNKRSFKSLAIRHAENWYKYTVLTKDRDAPNGSLYIVTSCIKCTDWGIAAFDRPSNPHDYLRFITNEENQNGQSKYRWKGSGAYIAKVALNRGSAGSNDADSPNQCVFLRGYKIMLRKDIWDNITDSQFTGTSPVTVSPYRPHSGNKSESPRQDDSNNQDDPSQSRADNSPGSDCGTTRAAQNTCSRTDTSARVILYEYPKTSPTHPSDLINTVLLYQEPKAKVALTHDDDWCDLLQYHSQILDSDALTKIGLPYTSNVDEYGCVSLTRSDLNPSSNAIVESSSDMNVAKTSENRLPSDNATTIPKLPSTGDDLALIQQDHPHLSNATTSSTPHSQTTHHFISSTTATVGSDVNCAFAREDVGVDAGVMNILDSFMSGGVGPSAATTLQNLPTYFQIPGSSKRYRCQRGQRGHVTNAAGEMQCYHERLRHSTRKYECSCGNRYHRKDSLARHMTKSACSGLSANRLPIDDTQVSHMVTNSTHKLPNRGDNLAFIQQCSRQSFTPMTEFPMPHSPTSHHFISSTTAGSDVDRVFAREDVGSVMSLPPFGSFMRRGAEPSAATMLRDLPTCIEIPTSPKRYRCTCGLETKTAGEMERHHKSRKYSELKYVCDCGRKYIRKDGLVRHMKTCVSLRANRLPIDDTQVSSHTVTNPTHKLPNKGDNLAFIQQGPRQSFKPMTEFPMPHSPTSHRFISSTTTTAGSDVDREDVGAGASLLQFGSLMQDEEITGDLVDLPTPYMAKSSTHELPDHPVFIQAQVHWQMFNATTPSSTPHSQSSHHPISLTESDLDLLD